MTHVAWVQWSDIDVPDGVELISDDLADLSSDALARITFYVPPYLKGQWAYELTERMPNLEVLQVPNAGYENALPFVRPGMVLCNASGVHNESTAEHAMALALAASRGIADFTDQARHHEWRQATYPSFTDSRVAVIGHGAIGRTILRMLSGFSVQTEAFSRRGTEGATAVSTLPDRIGEFDIVILILPLTDESAGLFDAAMLGRMKDGALLVNVARGGIVDTDALVAELQSGRLRAALDVTDPEPLPADHPLWDAPGCLITPHVGGNTFAFQPRMCALIGAQLRRLVSGQPLENVRADRRASPSGQ